MELGRINFADLALVVWKSASNFLPMQDFLKDYDKTIYESLHGPGVISGCEVTVVAGLTVRIAAGIVLFDNGELCSVEQQDIVLSTADPTNPRIDRIELTFAFANNLTVENILSVIKQFDKLARGTGAGLPGTPAGSPTIPAKTGGAVTLASVDVAALQTVLVAADISQSDLFRDPSKFAKPKDFDISIPASTAGQEDIKDLVADKARFRQVWLDYQIRRKTDTGSSGVVNSGTLHMFLNPEGLLWDFSDERHGNDDVLVDFDVDDASGQVSWDVTLIAGTGPIGSFTFNKRTIDV